MFAASKTASVSGGYQISRSLRFNSPDSAYLNRTPASAGNRKTWTFSTWVKRSQLSSGNAMLATVSGSAFNYFSFGTSSGDWLTFAYFDGTSDIFGVNTSSTSVFRDVSAWYHIVLLVDTTQATAANRVKIYVNNVEQTLGGTYPTQNYDTPINNTISNLIGGGTGSYTAYLADQYMTEVNFIDGQALTPSSFGETNAQTGVWQPKAYAGSYGTNGFYLNFSDNSNTTAATLGKDYSGNGNNWTPNNFSVTAGAGNDSLVDSPTSYGTDTGVGGTVRGNYSTLNPLQNGMANAPRNGNLEIAGSADIYRSIFNTIGVSSGKWYFEVVITSGSGVTNVAWSSSTDIYQYAGSASTSYGYELENGNKINNGGTSAYGSALTTNDVFMCAADMDNLKLFFGKNGTWFASSDPVAGTSPAYTFAAGTYFFQMRPYTGSSSVVTTNFGQRPFAYTAPSGYKALCTQNLPTPTIGATTATQAGKFFNPVLFNKSSFPATVTGVGFQPDFTWWKARSAVQSNVVFDVIRGSNSYLLTNTTDAEATQSGAWTANSDGWTSQSGAFSSSVDYVAWNWKASGSTVTNTAGSITSTVSANTTSGFSVVTYTGTGTQGPTVGHGLGVAPKMIILKCRNTTDDWNVYHASLGASYWLQLDTTAAAFTGYNGGSWNNTAPTSSVFTVNSPSGYPTGFTNQNTITYVAYCFAEVAGYSKFGSYTGNGSADGPFTYTGFRPRFVMIKRSDAAGNWYIFDTTRSTTNVISEYLFPNRSDAETTNANLIDIISNGFKLRSAVSGDWNASGGTYIFAAFAEAPQKFALAR